MAADFQLRPFKATGGCMTSYEANLPNNARSIARQMSYSNSDIESKAKFLLIELADKLDSKNIEIKKKADGLMIINGHGRVRYLNWKETLAFKLLKIIPSKV